MPPAEFEVPSSSRAGAATEGSPASADESGPGESPGPRRRLGLIAGPLVLITVFLLPAPQGMSEIAWRTVGVGLWMAIWWITEAIPIAATALLPLVLFAPLGILPVVDAASPYANPIIFLFLGGFVIALAMERWDLHRRVALGVVRLIGIQPHRLVLGFMVATAFLSMWVSNTATAVMMTPIAISVIHLARPEREPSGGPVDFNFGITLMLAVAYAASIGGLGTLIGTPPNALLAGFMLESYGIEIGFAQWMLVGLPLVVVSLPLAWLVLTRLVYPIRLKALPGGRAAIDAEYRKLGRTSRAEKIVAAVFVATAFLWITRPLLQNLIPGLNDSGIAVAGALILFVLPVGGGRIAMNWKTAEQLPWGVLLLFGGGLSLAAAVQSSGLAEWIGTAVGALGWPVFVMVVFIATVIIFLTELTSNTATAAAFLPLVASVAIGLGENPFLLAIPAALAASCAFMMPVATPPNAIVFGSGQITIPQMARAGIWLNLIFLVLITLLVYSVALLAFGIEPGVVPAWARG